jgi:hypothetical protein
MDTIVGSWTISETTDKRDEKDYDRDKNVDEIIGQETESITFTFNADGTFLATQKRAWNTSRVSNQIHCLWIEKRIL